MTAEFASEFAKATCADGLAESVSARSASSQGAVGEWAPSVPPVAREDEHASTTILMLARIWRLVNGFAFNGIASPSLSTNRRPASTRNPSNEISFSLLSLMVLAIVRNN